MLEVYNFPFSAWIYATISIVIISLCGLVGIAVVPLAKSIAYDEILRFLIALAIGTLCGDALMVSLAIKRLLKHNDNVFFFFKSILAFIATFTDAAR